MASSRQFISHVKRKKLGTGGLGSKYSHQVPWLTGNNLGVTNLSCQGSRCLLGVEDNTLALQAANWRQERKRIALSFYDDPTEGQH